MPLIPDRTVTSIDPNRPNFLELSPEIRNMIYDLIFQDTYTMVGHYGPQGHWEPAVRRLLAWGAPPNGTPAHPPHVLAYIHPIIRAEIQARWDSTRLIVSQTRFLPAGMLNGITHLSIDMENAVRHLAVVVPRVPFTHQNRVPPTTPLTLRFAPNIQELEIRWNTKFDDWYAHEDEEALVVLTRLQYFRRSFRVTVKVSAYFAEDEDVLAARISILDNPSNFEWILPHHLSDWMKRDAFLRRMRGFAWNATCLHNRQSPQRKAVVEAHPFHRYAPLGYVDHTWPPNIRLPDNFRTNMVRIQGNVPRPYST